MKADLIIGVDHGRRRLGSETRPTIAAAVVTYRPAPVVLVPAIGHGAFYNGALSWRAGDVPVVSAQGIFLSYRREDAAPYARLLQFQLRDRFPDVRVFMDLDSIEAGLDFAEVIREWVDSCAVLVALIGRQWATLADEQGRRRLETRMTSCGLKFRQRWSAVCESSQCWSMALGRSGQSSCLLSCISLRGSMPSS